MFVATKPELLIRPAIGSMAEVDVKSAEKTPGRVKIIAGGTDDANAIVLFGLDVVLMKRRED